MKPRRILHEKTQRFLIRRWRTEEGVYINKSNKEQRWRVSRMIGLFHHEDSRLAYSY